MATVRSKTCVVCGKSFKPVYTTTQRACGYQCAKEFGQIKNAISKEGLKRLKNEKKKSDDLQVHITYTEDLVHQYIRLRDKGKPCVSCGANWASDFQACHVFSKKQHNMIRFFFDNIHGGCKKCNIHLDGNYDAYRYRLPKRIGQEKYDVLEEKAKIAFAITFKWTRWELKEIQKEVKQKIKFLQKKTM